MAKRLNKNDIVRGRIFDMLAEQFGNSVLGVYDGKLRIEIIDEETDEVVQFSLAPTVHKTLVEETECDEYVSIKDRIAEYQASLKKNEPAKPKKAKKKKEESAIETAVPVEKPKKVEVAAEPVKPITQTVDNGLTDDEQSKIDDLMKEIGDFNF